MLGLGAVLGQQIADVLAPVMTLSRWYVAVPLVLVVVYGMMRANYRRYVALHQRVAEVEAKAPRPRIEAYLTAKLAHFKVWNDGATGTFRARYEILEAYPPLDFPDEMKPNEVHWLHPSAAECDSTIFAGDYDEFEVSLILRARHGPPCSFFATHYEAYDPATDRFAKGPPVTPETPVEERWLDIGITITTQQHAPIHWWVFRVHHDVIEQVRE